ncbi:MAG: FKBP-type peptidyl-prolyl cis-trans isomerase [Betaproteobacteria bacterium]|jgi:FKBP-type peptidyl-prolyl cis-trans isomerase|nr:FKBP-type peptidyl-prolyl cis-trans isomerase [Candidatus Binatia bacterium]
MKAKSGIKLLDDREGSGEPAKKGDKVIYNVRIHLNKGDEVPLNERQAEFLPAGMLRTENGRRLVDHELILGKRRAIAGVEYALIGMKPGGYRKVRLSPHLAYRDEGLTDLIPPNAILKVELWLRQIVKM